ncbi:aldose epimerase [Brevibacillus dissolubilis]|uniref:aldose epimerase family protein n=1 Tax=Brevibacillus dissolubilis TaxID=1844116 RepID=UPI0021005259|nr:aldose epimerase [Brevibacillus dissolubilis]
MTYQVNTYMDQQYQIYELTEAVTNSWVKVAPERGGIIISLGIGGRELLFLNKETFYDPTKNIRGGIPILFPACGQMENATYEWNGQAYPMPNHGFARNKPWTVAATDTEEKASITLVLASDDDTRKYYPFDFELRFTYILQDGKLTIQQEYHNRSGADMPMYAGFHPYFRVADKEIRYETDAQRCLNYRDMTIRAFEGVVDLSDLKQSVALLDAVTQEIAFDLEDTNQRVVIEYGEEFRFIMLWTEEGQDFVCVEPWMALGNELNRKEQLQMVPDGGVLRTEVGISLQ